MTINHDDPDNVGRDRPRENRGRRTDADALRAGELKSALSEFGDAYTARGVSEGRMIRALSTAYGIAWERAQATIASPAHVRGSDEQVFSWHFTSVLGEFAVATHDSDRSLRNRAADAHLLVTKFLSWVEALEAGFVDMRHVTAMLQHSRALDDSHLPAYGAQVLEYASSHTPGQTARFAERAASTIAAEAFEAAHERARAQRSVRIRHDGLGMAVLNAYLPSEIAAPIGQLLDKRAREQREFDAAATEDHAAAVRAARVAGAAAPAVFAPDARTVVQIRADVFAETLLCATPGASNVRAVVSITVPALTLLAGRVDGTAPALLDGMLPMSFTEARQLAGEATSFERVLTDPVTGHTTCVDTYRPDSSLRRFLQVRDRTCRFPGCIRPAALSDLDHTTPYIDGGATSEQNLAHLCRGHHVQKHEKPWSVTNLGGGVLKWQTPLGQIVATAPEPIGPRFHPKINGTAADCHDGGESQFGDEQNSASVPTDSNWADENDRPLWDDTPPPF
ncbi:MAG: HNH endonuclease [Gulosibacter sp.]|uniref:HNH endonuclease signature motif containing protein n=1 Tax=Gulosibacter sp. TaxID=2817531 RepID=UPI003F8E5C40